MEYSEIADRLISVFFPQRCLFCDEVVAYDDFWCGRCAENGKPPYLKQGKVGCDFSHSFADALAAIQYGDRARKLIWRIKGKADKHALRFLEREILSLMSEYWSGIAFNVVVPVPTSKSRLRERGFNPAEMLARRIGRRVGIPVCGSALIRFETPAQRGLTKAQRQVNAAESYAVGEAAGLSGKRLLLVDDVFTTGATAEACSRKLLEAGADSVYVVTAAFTKPDKDSR